MISRTLCLIAIVCIAVVSAYSRAEPGTPESQVVVRVNGRAISVQQLRHGIGPKIGEMTPEQLEMVATKTLEELIDEELLVQGAVTAALDDEPAVRQAVNAQRRRVLALAYVERVTAAAPERNEQTIREFYDAHPELFKQRRIYHIHELFIAVPPNQKALLKAKVASSTGIADITGWLAAQRLAFKESAATWAAEQVPAELLSPLAAMKETDIALFDTAQGSEIVMVLHLIRATDAALSEAQAAAQIEELLETRRRLEVGLAEVKRLRDTATIEYPGQAEQSHPGGRDQGVPRLEVNRWRDISPPCADRLHRACSRTFWLGAQDIHRKGGSNV